MEAHIHFNAGTQYGLKLRQMLTANESADQQLADMRDLLIQMRDGDGSQDAHYTNIVKRLEVADYTATQGTPTALQLTTAKNLFNEIDSCYLKTSGNGSVTNVRAARDQLFAKTRG